MEHVCARCARLGFGSKITSPSPALAGVARAFSTSRTCYDEGDKRPSSSSPPRGRPLPGTPLRRNTPSSTGAGAATPRPGGIQLQRTDGPRTQTASGANTGTGTGTATGPRSGVGAAGRTPPSNRVLQRTGPPRPSQGQLLVRRTQPGQTQKQGPGQGQGRNQQAQGQRFGPRAGPRGPGQSQFQSRTPGGGGGPSNTNTNTNRTDRRVRRLAENTASRSAEEEDPSSFHAQDLPTRVENYISTIVDPPVNPTTELPHTPGTTLAETELRKDWPNTPLSNAGLVESVQQRIEWLAHRLPHGYQTPNQLAMHYTRGYLTRFESVQERDEVLSISRQLAQKWADRDTEKSGSSGEVQPENMDFDSIADREGERNGLAETWVKGVYPVVQKQKMPFLDQIVRNLNNNGTVTPGKAEQFMQTVQSVIVSRQPSQGGGQAPKVAQK
ncbi:hypothetical protein G647_02744 [Cladophialophora carrionii CBS 160.54]|uniref:Uncharacterized protein n=1 Tax=Cladophialophora carrionii CBS 160.54 TaxID=1279043 RepID=V9DJ53_9EURO|nr:uncharacterized protein G647_02744 [Cladophialophora carrionii CBS 160.54]ETI25967.1 hypothetical protein G647_02744 [Cladophialophora carrionii CBS 160.54]